MVEKVSDSFPCEKIALTVNIDGLKDLAKRKLASTKDVSSTPGYSVLCVSSSLF